MSEQRYRYASVGITEEKDVPAVLLGKRNATFEIAGMEYERTAILKLPERMNQTEFDTWKESGGVDLIDMYFHCIHQKSVWPEEGESGSSSGSDGGPTDGSSSESESEEAASGGENQALTDGGSSMPKLSIEHLKELDKVDEKIGEWVSERVGEPINGMTDLYRSEHSKGEAMEEVELGDGFSVKEPEYIELLTLIDSARKQSANDPPTLGVVNRLLMQVILANPEAYARVREEMRERAEEAHAEMQRQRNQQRERQRVTDRSTFSGDDDTNFSLDGEGNDA